MLGAGLGSVNIWSLCLGFCNVFCSVWGYSRGDSHGIIYIKFRGGHLNSRGHLNWC